MATSLVINGVSYLYPDTGDQSWGTVTSAWAAAVTTGMLQKSGGAFTLTADVNFGGNFGLLSKYFTSLSANPASTGQVRLASSDSVSFRNNANAADIALAKNGSDQLTWAGTAFLSNGGILLATGFPALTGDVTTSQGSLATSVSKIQGVAVGGTTGTGNVAFSASPTFTGTISAAALTLSTALGIASGGTGQTTQTASFNALQPGTTKGDLIVFDGTNAIRLARGSDGQVLSALAAAASGLQWVSPLTNPMTTLGDIITGGASGAATRLAGDTSNSRKFLRSQSSGGVATAPVWDGIQASDVPTLNQNTTGTAANVTGVVALANGGTGAAAASANAAFNALSPMTAGGDLIYGGASGAATRLANGTVGQRLMSNGGTAAPTWAFSQVAIGTAVTTTFSAVGASNAWSASASMPTITFTASASAKYKLFCAATVFDSSAGAQRLRIQSTGANTPTVNFQQVVVYDSTTGGLRTQLSPFTIVTLTSGTAYTFTLQAFSPDGSLQLNGSLPDNGIAIIAEQIE